MLALALTFNIPEGFAVVAPVLGSSQRGHLARLAALTGLVEIPAMLAYLLASSITAIIAPAAGAMLYVVFDELLPNTLKDS